MSVVEVTGFGAGKVRSLKIHAVVLDLDGVLVDSHPCWIEAERIAVAGLGGRWIARVPGSGIQAESSTGLALLALRSGLRGLESELAKAIESAVVPAIRSLASPMPGVRAALERMPSNVPVAVATNTTRTLATNMLTTTGLARFVDVLVCSDDVQMPKPAPKIYEVACERLGLLACDCLAIDDTPEGVQSAILAGLPTLALGHKARAQNGIIGFIDRLDDLKLEPNGLSLA